MSEKRVLVVFHSVTGRAKAVAEAVSELLAADLEQIREVQPIAVDLHGKGLTNFMNMGRVVMPALRGRATPIHEAQFDPAAYDLVIVGTPVYAGSLSGPARAYLQRYGAGFKSVAFFATGEDPNQSKVFPQMESASGQAPRVTAGFKVSAVKSGEFREQVKEFVASL